MRLKSKKFDDENIIKYGCLIVSFSTGVKVQKTDITQQLMDDQQKNEHIYNELIPFWDRNAVDEQY